MNKFKIVTFFTGLLFVISSEVVHATEGTEKKNPPLFSRYDLYPGLGLAWKMQEGYNPQQAAGFYYLEVGGGVSLLYQSTQNGLENDGIPFHFFAEYGNTASPLSVGLGFNTGGRYVQDGVVLRPNYIPVYAKYNVAPLFYFIPKKLDVYGLAGISAWQADLNDERLNQPEENRFQSDGGVGLVGGVGATYRLGNFGIGAQFTYFSGKGKYALGGTESTEINTGSAQLSILLSYRFIFGGDRLNCPTYVR